MNIKIPTIIFAAVLAVFTFSSVPAMACPGVSDCPKHASKVEKKCKKGCTKPCCAKADTEKKCKKAKTNKAKTKLDHEDSSRYND